ncbi:MAG TPA: potassium/proton antiporter [Myxococcales bacterium]|jgi:cell volume regulation protein A
MELAEPGQTAVLLAAVGGLALVSVLFSRAAGRVGLPVNLAFLALGLLVGIEGLGGSALASPAFAFRVGVAALVLILFDGGLNTPLSSLRRGMAPAGVLATVGVVGTAAVLGLFARLLGFTWTEAFLIGAIVSSTDAAAVFAVLRGSGLQLKKRVGVTLELESGLNDPMAVILTVALTGALSGSAPLSAWLALDVLVQLAVGAAAGVGFGLAGRWLLARAKLPAAGLYPALTLALAFVTFGATTLAHGSGFLAVYVAGAVLGHSALPYKTGLLRVHDAVAWLSQIGMFLVLGLLADPTGLWDVAWVGLALSLVLAFVARPVVVAACLAPFRYPLVEIGYIGWVGLRGAVPIILGVFPVLAGAPGAGRILDVVFFIVVLSALLPGGTVRQVTEKLDLASGEPPPSEAVLEIASTRMLHGEVLTFFVEQASAVCGSAIQDLPFPDTAAVMLVVRGEELVAPKGKTVFLAGDHVYLFCAPEDRPLVQLIFGRPGEG